MTKEASERSKQRAAEVVERARNAAAKARADLREYTEGVLAIGARVLEEGEYPPKKLFSDALTTTLHGVAIWASWWLPPAAHAGAEPDEAQAQNAPKK
jgi:hypothetical protein